MSTEHIIKIVLFVSLVLGVIFCLALFAFSDVTPKEALLLSILLTIFSLLGSWLASMNYAERSSNKSMRLIGLKAAEKVTNLSNEIDRLSASLQEELSPDGYETTEETLASRNFRIENTIHILHTLKSVNEGSLSDWQGVIGKELDAKLEDQEEREESLRELFERFDSLQDINLTTQHNPEDNFDISQLQLELSSMKNDLGLLTAQVSGKPIKRRSQRGRETVTGACPSCGENVHFTQRRREGSIKSAKCDKCQEKLYSEVVDGDFVLHKRVPIETSQDCPECGETLPLSVDPVPGTIQSTDCTSCQKTLRIIRHPNGTVRLKAIESTESPKTTPLEPLTEEILANIEEAMGPQPWPQGKSKEVAKKLSLPNVTIKRAIRELISTGVFKAQVNGKLFTPEE